MSAHFNWRAQVVIASFAFRLLATAVRADDWPQWRGPNRDGVWRETDVLQTFPPGGLSVRSRAPVDMGFSTPVIAQGRVYVTDATTQKPRAWERVHCFDEKSGAPLWTHSYEVKFPDWAFDPQNKNGPASTPIVEAGKIFALGITGQLFCLDAQSGAVVWERNLGPDYDLAEFSGTTPSPLIEGDLLIIVIGGKPNACVVALDKNSGKEVWRALDDRWTYSSPAIIDAGGKRQLIVWTTKAVTSLDPATGRTNWRELFNTEGAYATATPVFQDGLLLLSGSMFQLDPAGVKPSLLWPQSAAPAKRVLSQTSLPLIEDGHVFSDKSFGNLVCLEARTGKQLWLAGDVTDHKNGACIHLTPNGSSTLLFTNEGNLIRAQLSAQGYKELSRVHVLDPTYPFAGRKVIWPPPAYANRHIFVRNDEELISASMAAKP